MTISKRERLILINQYKILASLNKNEADHYEELITILENGYAIFYSEIDKWVSEEMDEHECRFVLEILGLYRTIEDMKRASNDPRLIENYHSFFRGFDGNNETEYMGFCRFLIEKQGKFQEQKQYLIKNDNLNSHSPMAEKYRRMLQKFQNFGATSRIGVDEIIEVLDA